MVRAKRRLQDFLFLLILSASCSSLSTYQKGNPPQVAPHCDSSLPVFNSPLSETSEIIQGYSGKFSHSGESQFALDFGVPPGTLVYAAKSGKVFQARFDSDVGGPNEKFVFDSNFVVIMHDDGLFSEYYHLKKTTPYVKVGDQVTEQQAIGEVGCTGFCAQPHLHFMVFQEGHVGVPFCLKLRAP